MKYTTLLITALFLYACGGNTSQNTAVKESEPSILNENIDEKRENTSSESPRVFISYNQPVNDYQITVTWFPWGGDGEVGHGILKFTHISERQYFYVFNSHFSDVYLDSLVRNHSYTFKDGEHFTLDYITPEKDEFIGHNTPFQFLDVDFDGEEELLINNWDCGQRSRNQYEVYKVKPFHAERLARKPFDNLEDGDEFDFKNKTITQFWSSGWNSFTKLVYRYHKTDLNYLKDIGESEKEIFDDFYYPIKLDSLFICKDGNMSVYVNRKESLVLIDSYKIE